MTNFQPKSKADGLGQLRQSAPLFSYSLLFLPKEKAHLLADLFLFTLELERICAQTTEAVLGLMRMQWWQDHLTPSDGQNNPLLHRLHSHIALYPHLEQELRHLLSVWRLQQQAEGHPSPEGWMRFFELIASLLNLNDRKIPVQIGHAVFASRNQMAIGKLPSPREIFQKCGKNSEIFIVLAYLAKRAGQYDITKDHLILFIILWQVLFKPAA